MFQKSTQNLNADQVAAIKGLLLEFQDVFSKGSYDLGCFTEIKHTIDTGDSKPVKLPMRHTPLGFQGEQDENLKIMLDVGVIQESCSDWASAPVLVRKKDGSVRYCINFCELNRRTVKDSFPLPSVSLCLDQISDNVYFSTLDMASGY